MPTATAAARDGVSAGAAHRAWGNHLERFASLADQRPAINVYGDNGDTVYVADWDGDGVDTPAVRRGNTYLVSNAWNNGVADLQWTFAGPHDEVYAGDWDGDGVDTLAVRRGNHLWCSAGAGTGRGHDVELPRHAGGLLVGDFTGDGADDIATVVGGTATITSARTGQRSKRAAPVGPGTLVAGNFDGRRAQFALHRDDALYVLDDRRHLTRTATVRGAGDFTVADTNGDGRDSVLRRHTGWPASYADKLAYGVNRIRRDHGLPELSIDWCARGFAERHAAHLASTSAFYHQSLSPVLRQCGLATAGENIAWGRIWDYGIPPEEMVSNWWNSPPHRANILNPNFRRLGSAYAVRPDGGVVGVHVFSG